MDLAWLGLIIPATYYFLSLVFLYFPNLLYRKYRYRSQLFNRLVNTNLLLCIGHRGGSWQGPQNTLELFCQNKDDQQMFELDVCLTQDMQLVVHHDSNLIRTCGVNVDIEEIKYSQMPHMLQEIIAMGGVKIKTIRNKIPLLKAVFQQFKTKPMNIQLKTPSKQAINQFNKLVSEYQRQSITIWGAASSQNNQNLRQMNEHVLSFYSAQQILKIFILFILGLLPFICLRQGIIDIPLYTDSFYRLLQPMMQTNFKKCLLYCACAILRLFNCLSKFFIPHLKKRGILTFYFILNEQEDFETAINTGCSGIMTDQPKKLRVYLNDRNLLYHEN